MATIGTLEVILYAGLRGQEPVSVGTIQIPLELNKSTSGVSAYLGEAIAAAGQEITRIFKEDK